MKAFLIILETWEKNKLLEEYLLLQLVELNNRAWRKTGNKGLVFIEVFKFLDEII